MARARGMRWLLVWAATSAVLGGALGWSLIGGESVNDWRTVFTPGPMTHGHHQIELACGACHDSAFAGGEALQQACVGCHGEQLRRAEDSHPKAKFTDPRNAELAERLDARLCVTCHVEHRPEITQAMAVTIPVDFCVTCHADIGEQRETHRGMRFDTCASSGCHNFHDNRALYEDFLLKHADAPALLDTRLLPQRDFAQRWRETHTLTAATTPDRAPADPQITRDWLETAHAAAGVNCSGCHAPQGQAWTDAPDHAVCANCHEGEAEGFVAGKHGMRRAQDLPAMRPEQARLPMQPEAAHRTLSCTSCHGAHRFDTALAAVEACLGCHADEHSLAYRDSTHFQLWKQERAGQLSAGSGVSCASCHLPRVQDDRGGRMTVSIEHNQNETLRPNENQIRPVCMHCHGLGFAIDALADEASVHSNFNHSPTRHIESIEMAQRRLEADRARRQSPGNSAPGSQ